VVLNEWCFITETYTSLHHNLWCRKGCHLRSGSATGQQLHCQQLSVTTHMWDCYLNFILVEDDILSQIISSSSKFIGDKEDIAFVLQFIFASVLQLFLHNIFQEIFNFTLHQNSLFDMIKCSAAVLLPCAKCLLHSTSDQNAMFIYVFACLISWSLFWMMMKMIPYQFMKASGQMTAI